MINNFEDLSFCREIFDLWSGWADPNLVKFLRRYFFWFSVHLPYCQGTLMWFFWCCIRFFVATTCIQYNCLLVQCALSLQKLLFWFVAFFPLFVIYQFIFQLVFVWYCFFFYCVWYRYSNKKFTFVVFVVILIVLQWTHENKTKTKVWYQNAYVCIKIDFQNEINIKCQKSIFSLCLHRLFSLPFGQ